MLPTLDCPFGFKVILPFTVVNRTKSVPLQTKLVFGFSDPEQTQFASNLIGSFSGQVTPLGHVMPM
jgi:hypothetical protein